MFNINHSDVQKKSQNLIVFTMTITINYEKKKKKNSTSINFPNWLLTKLKVKWIKQIISNVLAFLLFFN